MFVVYIIVLLVLYHISFLLGVVLFPNRVYIVAAVVTISVLALILYKLDKISEKLDKQEEKDKK